MLFLLSLLILVPCLCLKPVPLPGYKLTIETHKKYAFLESIDINNYGLDVDHAFPSGDTYSYEDRKRIVSTNKIVTPPSTVIIFDWDDTLLCSTELAKYNFFAANNEMVPKDHALYPKIRELEAKAFQLLTTAMKFGSVFIVTASQNWVYYTANLYFPKLLPLLNKMIVISCHEVSVWLKYSSVRPLSVDDYFMFPKYNSFLHLIGSGKNNIVSIGDSDQERTAVHRVKDFVERIYGKNIYSKSIKLIESPKIDQLSAQLVYLKRMLAFFCSKPFSFDEIFIIFRKNIRSVTKNYPEYSWMKWSDKLSIPLTYFTVISSNSEDVQYQIEGSDYIHL